MSENLTPIPNPGQKPPPFDPAHVAPPPQKSHKTRNIILGCLLAFLIGVGFVALLLISICSGLNNMH